MAKPTHRKDTLPTHLPKDCLTWIIEMKIFPVSYMMLTSQGGSTSCSPIVYLWKTTGVVAHLKIEKGSII